MISLEERDEDVFLRAIEILSTYQNQSIGARIIQQIITDAATKQKPVLLYVLKVNPAKRLYERLGFSTVEGTDTQFHHEDLTMKLGICLQNAKDL